jgi:hypothetical protein
MGSKKEILSFEHAARKAIESVCAELGVPVPALSNQRWKPRQFTAPRTLLVSLLRPTVTDIGLKVWRPEPGKPDAVYKALQNDGPAHDNWISLAETAL